MSKNKKGKIVSLKPGQLSPEKYFKTQARTLPIVECLVTAERKNIGICSVFVARSHKTGNVTVGIYLVDMYCLGLKDTHYEFNISPGDYKSLKNSTSGMEKCDYLLAHNIVYGGIAFADDNGFKPHKDFAVSQYILEDDDEQVELMELDFGLHGMPCYMRGPYDDAAKIKSVTATLERTAGPGNFTIVDPVTNDEWGVHGEDDQEFEEDDPEFGDMEGFDPDALMEDLKESYAKFPVLLEKINKAHDEFVRTPEAKEILEKSNIGNAYVVSESEAAKEYVIFENATEQEEYNRLKLMVMDTDDYDNTAKEIKKAIKEYPDKRAFYDLLIPVYSFGKKFKEQDELALEIYKRFPDDLYPKIAYANLLINENKTSEVLPVFNGQTDLHDLYPDREVFSVDEAADFYATMCRYYIATDDIDSADLYMNALFKEKLTETPADTLAMTAVMELAMLK